MNLIPILGISSFICKVPRSGDSGRTFSVIKSSCICYYLSIV